MVLISDNLPILALRLIDGVVRASSSIGVDPAQVREGILHVNRSRAYVSLDLDIATGVSSRLSRLPWSPPSAKDCRRPGMPNPRMCAGSAARALGSGGSGRGAALMALPEASWLRWSNLRPRKAADRPKAVEDAYDRCWAHLPPCCARAASSRFMRSSTSLCS